MPAPEDLFLYYLIHPDDFVTHYNQTAAIWQDGQLRPMKSGQRIRHDQVQGQCVRYDYDFQIGWKTLKSADYNVLMANTKSAENEAMIAWTEEAIALIEDAANWNGNTADAADLDGGATWDAGTPENPVIKKTLGALAEQISLGTNGIVGDFENPEDVGLILLLAPGAARRMAVTPEIHAIYKESLYADALVTRQSANPNAVWQLPARLYGFTVVVENAVQVSTSPVAAATAAATTGSPAPRSFLKSYTSAAILSRVGGIDGEIAAPNFSTVQRDYTGTEMAVKIFDEPKHELTDGHVERCGTTKLAAPASGFLITNIFRPGVG